MIYHPQPDQTSAIHSSDGVRIVLHEWHPNGEVKGAVLFLHGMAEHARRYAEFADQLTKRGWHVFMPDLRGHGLSAGARPGIAGEDAWNGMMRDAAHLLQVMRQMHPAVPLVVGGYSMGSMLVQRLMQLHGTDLDGAMLIATGGSNHNRLPLLVTAIREEVERGSDAPSELQRWSFHEFYNIPFQPVRTLYDWLSRDQVSVDEYIADPLCGISLSTNLMADYAGALMDVVDPPSYALIPPTLPVIILHGMADSSSPMEGVAALIHQFIDNGMQDVSWHLYPEARHDLLHESNREHVSADILRWLARW